MIKRRLLLFAFLVCLTTLLMGQGFVRATTYADKVLTYNPIAYWQLNETVGTTAEDSSGNNYDGTYYGVTLDQIDGPGSTMGKCGYWDGINDYVDIYSSGLATAFNGQEGSISYWYQSSVRGNGNYYTSRISSDASNYLNFWQYTVDHTFGVQYVAAGTVKGSTIAFTENQSWHFAVHEWSKAGGYFDTYIDNVLEKHLTGIGTWNGVFTSHIILIGAETSTPTKIWKGYICHFATFTYPLSTYAIADLADTAPLATPTPTSTPTMPTNTPRPPQFIATLQNGNQWQLEYTITAGQIGQFVPILLFIGLFIFIMILKLVKR